MEKAKPSRIQLSVNYLHNTITNEDTGEITHFDLTHCIREMAKDLFNTGLTQMHRLRFSTFPQMEIWVFTKQ